MIARVPAPLQPELRDQAALWLAFSPTQRRDFTQRAAQWDAQPRATQVRLRERYAAWRALDPIAFEAVESAVQAFAHRTPQEQATLRAQFDALDPIAQRGWLLGPAIGGDYPKLHALLAQLPQAQHAPMLRMLRRMNNAERADLSRARAACAAAGPPGVGASVVVDSRCATHRVVAGASGAVTER